MTFFCIFVDNPTDGEVVQITDIDGNYIDVYSSI